MNITKRQEQILELLRDAGHMSVRSLSELTYTSEASIRRDLLQLQNMYLIKRTHGGAGVLNDIDRAAPLSSRMAKNAVSKRKIACSAATLLRDDQIVMLDGSSTAGFLIPHIAKHKNIQLFTNNMLTAVNAINYGIKTHCIGGSSVNNSAVLSGAESYRRISEIQSDILFFSSHSLDKSGIISDPTEEENYLRTLMLANTRESVFLCDSEKFGRRSVYTLTSIDSVDVAVFDTAPYDLVTTCRVIITNK